MRDVSTEMRTELDRGLVRPAFFVEIEFASSTEYLWSGVSRITWNGHTWLGVGALGRISAIVEQNEIQAQNLTLSLSSVPTDLLDEAINECRLNKDVRVWFGLLLSTGEVIADPTQVFTGFTDVPTIREGTDEAIITITVENRLIALQQSCTRRFTNEDQKIDYPTDKGFEYVAAIQNWNGKWGKA